MKVLVDAQKKLNIPLSNKDNELLGDQLLLFDNTASLNNTTFPQFKVQCQCSDGYYLLYSILHVRFQSMLHHLWSDKGIQKAFDRRNEFQLTDSVQYFLDSLERVASSEYVPTLQDILYARKTTKGVIECRIDITG